MDKQELIQKLKTDDEYRQEFIEKNIQMGLLAEPAGLMAYAFHNTATGGFILFPAEDYGTPKFKAAVEDAARRGFKMLAVLALLNRATPLIQYELIPGAPEKAAEAAKVIWRDQLIGEGLLKPQTDGDA
jgi:hypothetical protein